MLLTIIIFCIIAYCICYSRRNVVTNQFKLWLAVFSVYVIYMVITHSFIHNPYLDYFVSSDQLTFYRWGVGFQHYSLTKIFNYAISQSPDFPKMGLIVIALWGKLGTLLGVEDIAAFLKLRTVFLGSLIPVFMYKIALFYVRDSYSLIRKLFLFSICTPIFSYSVQILRDIDVTFLYILIVYVSLNKKIKGRFIYASFLALITAWFRLESGLFSILFICIGVLDSKFYKSKVTRVFVWLVIAVLGIAYIPVLFETADSTLTLYAANDAKAAGADSMGLALWNKFGPLAPFVKLVFSFLLPFPFWKPMLVADNYVWCRIVDCVCCFYWLPICVTLFVGWWKKMKVLPSNFSYLLLASTLFLILNVIGELNIRRLVAVYPIMYCLYLRLTSVYKFQIPNIGYSCFAILIVINGIYFLIK